VPEVAAALLCDHATVREGLLHVLGAGITRVWRDEFPAPLGVGLAIVFELHQDETGRPHELAIHVRDEDGGGVAEVKGAFGADKNPTLAVHERILVPMAFNLQPAQIEKHGNYEITLLVDGQFKRSIQFAVRPSSERAAALLPPAPPDG
jgi:hypothetical protein